MHVKLIFATIAILCKSALCQVDINYKICDVTHRQDECEQLARTNEVACLPLRHNVDCVLNVKRGSAHLGKLKPEEAFLAASFSEDSIEVIGEIKDHSFESVVVVKAAVNSIQDLKGGKYCHPGFFNDPLITPLILQEFESKVVDKSSMCDVDDEPTLLGKYIKTLSSYFGSACRPGPWTQDKEVYNKLKNKYSNLCALCGTSGCDTELKVPLNDTLSCLTSNDATVAVTSLRAAKGFFKDAKNAQNYKYLCKDGSTKPAGEDACIWTSQLPSLLITNGNSADYMRKFAEKLQPVRRQLTDADITSYLRTILAIERGKVVNLIEPVSLKTYVEARREIPTVAQQTQCDTTMKWCTLNPAEQEKCSWLSQASLNRAIQPVVECKQAQYEDSLYCVDDVSNARADVFTAPIDDAYVAYKKGLTELGFPETDTRKLSAIYLVIRSDDTSITSFNNLKTKKSCFPKYGGKEWLAFVTTGKKLGVFPKDSRDYDTLVYDFVGDSCMPGAKDKLRNIPENVKVEKMCKQCLPFTNTIVAATCNADFDNKYFGSNGSLKCLENQSGDFAVVTLSELNGLDVSGFKVLCRNNSLAKINGIINDNECALNTVINTEIVGRKNEPKNQDFMLALEEYEKWFGEFSHKSFYLFEEFNQTKDLLFKDSTPGVTFDDSNTFVKNFKDMLTYLEGTPSSSTSASPTEQPNAATTMELSTATALVTLFLLLRIFV